MDKAPDAYRTISEVAEDLDLPQHVLRFWETRFSQIRPLKRGGGRRYYRPDDVDFLRGIRHLLYGEGYTIRGVQRIIKESGVKALQALGRGEGAAALPKPKGPEIIGGGYGPDEEPAVAEGRLAQGLPDEGQEDDEDLTEDEPYAPPASRPFAAERPVSPYDRPQPVAAPVRIEPVAAPVRPQPEPQRPPQPAGLAPEDVRRLQSALYELMECRRKLDQVLG